MAGLALRSPRRAVHGDGREGLPHAQAALHPDCAVGSRPGEPLGGAHGRAPDDVDLGAYGLRVWIEQGFRTLKRMGWQWHRTRRVDPARVDRHWLVLAVATLWVLAYGTRVEKARLRGLAPGRVRRPPPEPTAARHRPLSLFQLGWFQAQRRLHRGYAWSRVWLQPLPGPDPPDGMQRVDPPIG